MYSSYLRILFTTRFSEIIFFLNPNKQGYGKSLWLMHGLFRSNGGCGYVKKPDFLMKRGPRNELFDPKVKLPVKKTLKVSTFLTVAIANSNRPMTYINYSLIIFSTGKRVFGRWMAIRFQSHTF